MSQFFGLRYRASRENPAKEKEILSTKNLAELTKVIGIDKVSSLMEKTSEGNYTAIVRFSCGTEKTFSHREKKRAEMPARKLVRENGCSTKDGSATRQNVDSHMTIFTVDQPFIDPKRVREAIRNGLIK